MINALNAIKEAAIASTAAPRFAVGVINGHEVKCKEAHGCRNSGKDSLRWYVDGKAFGLFNTDFADHKEYNLKPKIQYGILDDFDEVVRWTFERPLNRRYIRQRLPSDYELSLALGDSPW